MGGFKAGSGSLDFESEEESGTENRVEEESGTENRVGEDSGTENRVGEESQISADDGQTTARVGQGSRQQYPYLVRRNNVGDERENRLEIHVRDSVVEREARFREELAEELGVAEVSKTDAREFALLVAFQNPEKAAKLMQQEGF